MPLPSDFDTPLKENKGWSPESLMSDEDLELYAWYEEKYGSPSTTWEDGTPRNPMPEIREQFRRDNLNLPGGVQK